MERYVDGFVIPIPENRVDQYKNIAEKAGAIWKEHGALEYWECIADDLNTKDMVSFRKAADARDNETVVFAWIVFKSREHRDKVNAAVMADPRLKAMMQEGSEPFDCKRMVYGGFSKLRTTMNYLLMCCFDEKLWGELPETQRKNIMDEYQALERDLEKTGHYKAGAKLGPSSATTTVRLNNGKPAITDGPFAETKEQIGGYHLIECENLDEAIAIAMRIPTLPAGGSIEVRPVEYLTQV